MADTTYKGTYELEFERPLLQIERQIAELEAHAGDQGVDIAPEVRKLRQNHTAMLKKTYAKLSAWQTRAVSQQRAVVEARRRVRLMEQLEERRFRAWQADAGREQENLAAELYLARWKRLRRS